MYVIQHLVSICIKMLYNNKLWGDLGTALFESFHCFFYRISICALSAPFQIKLSSSKTIPFFNWICAMGHYCAERWFFYPQLSKKCLQVLYQMRLECFKLSIIPYVSTRAPVPTEKKEPNHIILPPPCFILGMIISFRHRNHCCNMQDVTSTWQIFMKLL